jgi:hypothetical protein
MELTLEEAEWLIVDLKKRIENYKPPEPEPLILCLPGTLMAVFNLR